MRFMTFPSKAGALGVLLVVGTLLATSSLPAHAELSLAQKLADIDAAWALLPDSVRVQRAEAALTDASKKCTMEPEKIGNAVVLVANVLQKEGRHAPPIDVLEGLSAIADEGATSTEAECNSWLVAYVGARQSLTHSGAVAGLRVIFKSVNPQRK